MIIKIHQIVNGESQSMEAKLSIEEKIEQVVYNNADYLDEGLQKFLDVCADELYYEFQKMKVVFNILVEAGFIDKNDFHINHFRDSFMQQIEEELNVEFFPFYDWGELYVAFLDGNKELEYSDFTMASTLIDWAKQNCPNSIKYAQKNSSPDDKTHFIKALIDYLRDVLDGDDDDVADRVVDFFRWTIYKKQPDLSEFMSGIKDDPQYKNIYMKILRIMTGDSSGNISKID